MKRLVVVVLAMILVGQMVHAHEDGLPGIDLDAVEVPQNISVFDFIRFTRLEHNLVLSRIVNRGDTHHVGTMTLPLTQKALEAGAHSPRSASKLVWDMAQLSDWQARDARLAHEAETLLSYLQTYQQQMIDLAGKEDALDEEIEQVEESMESVEAMIDLVTLWRQNPMDGAGS